MTDALQAMAQCPTCSSTDLRWDADAVCCVACKARYGRRGNFIDFVEGESLHVMERTALEVWGNDLHNEALAAPAHFVQLELLFPELWRRSLKGTVLDIGCGSGTDAAQLGRLHPSVSLFAFDLGANVAELARVLDAQDNVRVFRANALRIPLRDGTIDMAYSFGVFHHTPDPAKCMSEAYRVLRSPAAMFFYVYSSHAGNPVKHAGVVLEMTLMRLAASTPRALRAPLLYLMSLPCLLLFSWPARLLGRFGMKDLARRFPMYWGTTPRSILPDLKDRLLSPVNHRFRKSELEGLLSAVGFRGIQVRETSAGLFAYCAK
jgi:SAM-dependent methyltransferase